MEQSAPPKVFVYDKLRIFFKHTDYHGFVHPYNYLEWTSYVREAFFQETVPTFLEVLERSIKMMTVKIGCSVLADSQFGDVIEAKLTVGRIKRASFDMIVRFFNPRTQHVACETVHTIVFANSITAKFADIPTEMMKVIVNYEEPKTKE